MRTFAALMLMVVFSMPTHAQIRAEIDDNDPEYDGPLVLQFPILTLRPPVTTDMPLDVLLGYIFADSLARSVPTAESASLINNLTESDTLQHALRYYYLMDDYDPVRFFQWRGWSTNGTYMTPPGWLCYSLMRRAYEIIPNARKIMPIHDADIIAHVLVHSVYQKTDTSARFARTAELVTCEIIDPIKGNRIPYCKSYDGTSDLDEEVLISHPALLGSCLQFDYRLEWSRVGDAEAFSDTSFGSPSGEQWIKTNHEYIVFLQFAGIYGRFDDTVYTGSNWGYLTPGRIVSMTTTGGMYPIIDGRVYDPNDDFGFGGNNLTTEAWKYNLRARINDIREY
jgi:hypothetical protein